MDYYVEIGSGNACIPSFVIIISGIRELTRGFIGTQISGHRQKNSITRK
jgi:hypothetical protein